jgi:hypothetical protein
MEILAAVATLLFPGRTFALSIHYRDDRVISALKAGDDEALVRERPLGVRPSPRCTAADPAPMRHVHDPARPGYCRCGGTMQPMMDGAEA